MRFIVKNYMKLFFHKWFETLVILLFLVLFIGTIIGFLATPLQLQTKIMALKNDTIIPTAYISENRFNPTNDFLEAYFMGDENAAYTLANGVALQKPVNKQGKHFKLVDQTKISNLDPQDPNALDVALRFSFTVLSTRIVSLDNQNNKVMDSQFVFTRDLIDFVYQDLPTPSLRSYLINQVVSQMAEVTFSDEMGLSMRVTSGNTKYRFNVASASPYMNTEEFDTRRSRISLFQGHNIQYDQNEVVISPTFFKANNFRLGQVFNLGTNRFTIGGVGAKYDEALASRSNNVLSGTTNGFSYVYTSYQNVLDMYKNNNLVCSKYHIYRLYGSQADVNRVTNTLNEIVTPIADALRAPSEWFSIQGLSYITVFCEIFAGIGVFIFTICVVFIFFVLKRDIASSRVQLGILKAFGYRNSELTWVFVAKTFVLLFLGTVIGYSVSCGIQVLASSMYASATILTYQTIFMTWWFALGLFLLVPAVFALTSFWFIYRCFQESALSLMTRAVLYCKRHLTITVLKYVFFPFAIVGIVVRKLNTVWSYKKTMFSWRIRHLLTMGNISKFVITMFLVGFSALALNVQLGARRTMYDISYNKYISYTNQTKLWFDTSSYGWLNLNDDNEFYFQSDYPNQYPLNTVRYFDTSITPMTQVIPQIVNMKTVEQISALIRTASTTFATLSTNNSNLTPGMLLTLTELLAPLDNVDDAVKTIVSAAQQGRANVLIQFLAWKNKRNNNLLSLPATTANSRTVNAIKASDMMKFACGVVNLGAATLPDCNNQSNWTFNTVVGPNKTVNTKTLLAATAPTINISLDSNAILSLASLKNSIRASYDPLIIPNALFFDSHRDFLSYELGADWTDDASVHISSALFDSTGTYGLPSNNYKWKVHNNSFQALRDESTIQNVIISKLLAKITHIKVGNNITLNFNWNQHTKKIMFHVSDINENDVSTKTIFMDYNMFLKKHVVSQQTVPTIFNSWLAGRNNIVSPLKQSALSNLADTIVFNEPALTFNVKPNASLMGAILNVSSIVKAKKNNEMIKLLFSLPLSQQDHSARMLNNISINDLSRRWTHFDVLKLVIKESLGFYANILLVFIVLNIVLLAVLLFVIINSIVDELAPAILMLKSIGYTTLQVNFMICGNYIIWILILFVGAYFINQLIWYVANGIIFTQAELLLNLNWSFTIPLLSFVILMFIIVIAFFTSLYRILKTNVTNITAFS